MGQDGGAMRLITIGDQAVLHARTRAVIEAALAARGDKCGVVVRRLSQRSRVML